MQVVGAYYKADLINICSFYSKHFESGMYLMKYKEESFMTK
jgi:hypothetical protein